MSAIKYPEGEFFNNKANQGNPQKDSFEPEGTPGVYETRLISGFRINNHNGCIPIGNVKFNKQHFIDNIGKKINGLKVIARDKIEIFPPDTMNVFKVGGNFFFNEEIRIKFEATQRFLFPDGIERDLTWTNLFYDFGFDEEGSPTCKQFLYLPFHKEEEVPEKPPVPPVKPKDPPDTEIYKKLLIKYDKMLNTNIKLVKENDSLKAELKKSQDVKESLELFPKKIGFPGFEIKWGRIWKKIWLYLVMVIIGILLTKIF